MTAHDKQLLDKCFKMTKKGKNTIPKGLHRSKEETDREIALRVAPELKSEPKEIVTHTLKRLKEGSPKESIVMHAGTTRNELMKQCRVKGIKNFRVLNKQEMTDILADIGNQKHIDAIVVGAVERWKSGWGKNNRLAGKAHKE